MCGELHEASLSNLLWGACSSSLSLVFSFEQQNFLCLWKRETCILMWLHCVVVVPFWLVERHNCYEMWSHNALWMLPWDGKARQVSIHANYLTILWFIMHFLCLNTNLTWYMAQVLLSDMFQVGYWYVYDMEEHWWRGSRLNQSMHMLSLDL